MKKNITIENEIIVIGRDHYNGLSVIRSLGECGIKPIYVLISDTDECMSSKSKYIKKLYIISEKKSEKLDDFLIKNFSRKNFKAILIPTGDPIEKFLDNNYTKLSKYFYLPNIDDKQGMILKHMDKMYQHELCTKNNVPIAKSYLINLKEKIDYLKFPKKVIIKPDISADGDKGDIVIAEGVEEIKKGIGKFKSKEYETVLVQEYLDYEMEYAMMGFSYKGKVIIPGINSNDYIYPSNRGNTSFAEMFPIEDFKYDLTNIFKMVEQMNYTGLFEIEVFLCNDKIYFNEMNFRNSANLYGYTGDKVKYVYSYILMLLNKDISNIKHKVTKHYHFCIEPLHFKNVFEGRINFFKCLYHIIISTKVIYNIRDLKPTFTKYKYAIRKRLHKKGE